MKLLQGQLKETLFEWPDGKCRGDMVQRSQRVLQENKVAYINGERTTVYIYKYIYILEEYSVAISLFLSKDFDMI